MEEKAPKFIWTTREDKIFIDRPLRKEIRHINISFKTEICVEIGRGKAVAFATRKTKILRPEESNGRFVFEHCDSGIVVGQNDFETWMVFLKFDNDDHTSLIINCDLVERLEELRLPKQFSGHVKTAMCFNSNVKKLTPLVPQLTLIAV